MKNIFFKKKSEKIVSDENFQYFSFSKGGLIDLELLNLPKNIVMKNMFLPKKKNLKKFWVQNFSLLKGGPFESEWLDLPRNTVIKNTFFFQKNFKKILGEKCSKFFIFQRGFIRLRMTWFA